MSKLVREDFKSISIYNLRKWGYIKEGLWSSGGVKWSNSDGEETGKINLVTDMQSPNSMFIELDYKSRCGGEEEWTPIKHKYPIVSTDCNYGKKRYWFVCSVYTNGHYCGRRVAKLYLGGGCHYFACRHCFNLTYRARIVGYSYTDPDIEEYGQKIKRWYYKGRLTRKHRKYLKMEESNARSWDNLILKIAKRSKKY